MRYYCQCFSSVRPSLGESVPLVSVLYCFDPIDGSIATKGADVESWILPGDQRHRRLRRYSNVFEGDNRPSVEQSLLGGKPEGWFAKRARERHVEADSYDQDSDTNFGHDPVTGNAVDVCETFWSSAAETSVIQETEKMLRDLCSQRPCG